MQNPLHVRPERHSLSAASTSQRVQKKPADTGETTHVSRSTYSRKSPLSLSVIICTRNRPDDLSRCMRSILIQNHPPNEVIIVDSSDDPSTRRLVDKHQLQHMTEMHYVYTRPGLTYQRNTGIARSTGDIIAFLDDDVVLNPNYFLEILKCFAISNDVYGAGGRVENVSQVSLLGKWFRKIFMLNTNGAKYGAMKRSGFASFQMAGPASSIVSTDVLSGCCFCFRKTLFKDNTFDEHFEGYGFMEDVEFSYRVSRGYRLLYTPFATLMHNKSPNARLDYRKSFEMQIVNHHYVFSKLVKKRPIDWLFFGWSDLGVLMRAIALSSKNKIRGPSVWYLRWLQEDTNASTPFLRIRLGCLLL